MIIKLKTKQLIQQALKEDIGAGDITTKSIIPKNHKGKFMIVAKEPSIVCGMVIAEACFEILDENIHFRPMVKDGARVTKNKVIAHIEGRSYSILLAERTALNFLGLLSGVSTLTDKFVSRIKDYNVQIMDTRKTIPTLRHLQKYAVKIGGGKNHRMGLYDQILIKDNHLSVAPIKTAIEKVRRAYSVGAASRRRIEVEVKNIEEFKQAIEANPDIIMLDNMKIDDIKEAIHLRDVFRIKKQDIGFKCLLEVSGNVSLDNVADIAKTTVDRISIGALTHSAPAIDFSLKG